LVRIPALDAAAAVKNAPDGTIEAARIIQGACAIRSKCFRRSFGRRMLLQAQVNVAPGYRRFALRA
jgi:hypothetical protein